MLQHIGIVACTAEGASLCYRTICAEAAQILGPHDHPEISLHSYSLADYMAFIHHDDWPAVGQLMLTSARKLASIGADFLICPDNTIHQALPFIQQQSPLPWLHIAEVVAMQAAAQGFRKVGLTGTKYLVESEVYPESLTRHGIEYLRPDPTEREAINTIIFDELVYGAITPQALACFQHIITRMKHESCDAVILGCTEIPLLLNDTNSPLPTLDSTRLLARAALQRAIQTL